MPDSLQKQLAELHTLHEQGKLSTVAYEAAVSGIQAAFHAETTSGAVAQGAQSRAAAKQAVIVDGNVGGSIFTGNIYNGPPPQDPRQAIRIYCQLLAQSSGHLPLRGVDIGASDPRSGQHPLQLANVYVNLDTTTAVKQTTPSKKEEQTRPLSALEAAIQHKQIVLLGDPGGGKSTFVNQLAFCLAAHVWQPQQGWLQQLGGWPELLIPLPIILRDFARTLPAELPQQAEVSHLWQFIQSRLKAQNLDFVGQPLRQTLEAGKVLLLFDGLDEIPTQAQRRFVRDAVQYFVARYPQNRAIVTCRVLSYQPPLSKEQPDLRLPPQSFPDFELALFNKEKISQFVAAWYAELGRIGTVRPEDVADMSAKLQTAVQRPDLRRLATNPLLLTVMALVHTHKGRLPDARALLYEETIDILLWRWEQQKSVGSKETPRLRQLLIAAERSDTDLKKTLWQLAYDAHAQTENDADPEAVAGIDELTLRRTLLRLSKGRSDWAWVDQMVQTMKLRAGLLLEREPEQFAFPHRTFQEYLAGAHLASQGDFAKKATTLAAEGVLWREVILLAVGKLVYHNADEDKVLMLVTRLCPEKSTDTETAWRHVWLAGDVLLEMGLQRVQDDQTGEELLKRVQNRLGLLLNEGKLTPRERAEAGDTLGRLGDPRPGVCTAEPELLPIPAGAFLMGEAQDKIELETFAIARTPVSNAQFALFVADGGYTEKWQQCWTKAGWQVRTEEGWQTFRFWDDPERSLPNQPVTSVSWYEAHAYCHWLRQTTGKAYRLPTEAEWERAAGHTDGREFSWGAESPTAETINYEKTNLNRALAVGSFPQDTAVCGAQDMGGNVSEWCQTRWQDEDGNEYALPYQPNDGREEVEGGNSAYRVWKGGAFNDHEKWVRCAYRYRSSPWDWNYFIGFRVVVSPFSIPLAPALSDL